MLLVELRETQAKSEGKEKDKERERRLQLPAGARSNYKIAKINHKTWPAYRVRYHKTSRTAGQSAHIFGVYEQSRGR